MKNFIEWLINESFDTVSDFLLNPEHRNKNWSQLMDEFEASGGKALGYGSYGSVFYHPRWPYVLKMYNDEYYTKFARFAYKNPHIAFPKIYNPPQRIIPFYKRFTSNAISYLVRMEKLEELPKDISGLLAKSISYGINYIRDMKSNNHENEYEETERLSVADRRAGKVPQIIKVKHHQYIIDILKQHPNFLPVYDAAYVILSQSFQAALDIYNPNNYMQRTNGDIVITDPLWAGSSPYADYQKMMAAETDNFSDFDYEEPNLIGGELPKRKRKKKIKPKKYFKNDDVPF